MDNLDFFFLSNEGLGIGLIDEDEGCLRQPPGPRSGSLRPEDPPAGAEDLVQTGFLAVGLEAVPGVSR